MPHTNNAAEHEDAQAMGETVDLMTEGPAVISASPLATAPVAQSSDVFAQAVDLGLRTRQGCPYAGMTCTVRKGELTVLRGRAGSGKTALLLTLAARMTHTQGTLTILGEPMPKRARKVQRRIGLGLVKGVNDLRPNLTVEATIAAELNLFGKPSKRDNVEEYLRAWQLEDTARMNVGDLPVEKLQQLGIALGMAGDPEALAVDDVETSMTLRQSTRLMELLARIAHERGVAVMVACTDRDLAQMADSVVELS
jgi:ABC-type multidrug transport system ATPase subunit